MSVAGASILVPQRRSRSPDPDGPVRVEHGVVADNRQILHLALRHEHPIEEISQADAALTSTVSVLSSYARTARSRSSSGYGFGIRAVDHDWIPNSTGQLDEASGDIPGAAPAYVEDACDGRVVALWSSGAASNQNPIYFQVVHVCTHPKIYRRPSAVSETLAFCAALLEPAHSTLIQPGERHWSIFTTLCESSRASGNLVQDAWLAALAIEHGCEWISTDGDYARFRGLRWRRPFE